MKKFQVEKEVFVMLCKHLDAKNEIRREFEEIIGVLLTQFNTTIFENRFVAGGALEHFFVALFNSMTDVTASHQGQTGTRLDIAVHHRGVTAAYSIKGIFSGGGTNLVNTRGAGVAKWDEATIFLVAEKGMYYADPTVIPAKEIGHSGDALTIKVDSLDRVRKKHPQYFLDIRVPSKSNQVNQSDSRVASREVAAQIIEKNCRLLRMS